MTVFLVPNAQKPRAMPIAKAAAELLRQYGANVLMEDCFKASFAGQPVKFFPEEQAIAACDAIVTVGGDGTILRIARRSLADRKPILGINVGRLGFLATVEADELHRLKRLVTGDYTLDRRSILEVRVGGTQQVQNALNEVVIGKAGVSKTIDMEIYCDGTLVNRYQGDGVIVATPTGSTAYSLSAGGPVLDARIAGLVVTPICAHSMHSPPMVFSAQRRLRVTVSSAQPQQVLYSCDGQAETPLSDSDTVEVALSDQYMTLICLHDADQFEAIDKKLKGR
ncbi:MAG: NAD(+)/NADH kinase [Ruthenibacterium sp.]